MKTRRYTDSDRAAWDGYVKRHPRGSFFHQIGWKAVIEKTFGHRSHYLVAETSENEERIAGVFPLFSIKSLLFGRCLVSAPFATTGGILADNDDVFRALYEKAVSLTREMDLDYLEIREEGGLAEGCVVKNLYYGFTKEIYAEEERNLTAIPRKSRRMIRNGIKNDLRSTFGRLDLLDEFYEMFAFSYRRLGTPVFSKRYLRNLLHEFSESSTILLISKNGTPLSGVLSFYFKDRVLPYYSGAYPDSQKNAANDFLYWALMCDAAEKGVKIFDFGRSKENTGPFDFKRHWGFAPEPLAYQYYLHKIKDLPNISPSNPKYRRRIEAWKKLPLWTTKIIGPRIVKYIP